MIWDCKCKVSSLTNQVIVWLARSLKQSGFQLQLATTGGLCGASASSGINLVSFSSHVGERPTFRLLC